MTPEEIMRDALRRIRDAQPPEGIEYADAWFAAYARQAAATALMLCNHMTMEK